VTRLELKSLVQSYVRPEAQTFHAQNTDLDAVINECLATYSDQEHSLALYSDNTELTLVTGTDTYDLMGASLSAKVCKPISVIIDQRPLVDFDGIPGPVGFSDLQMYAGAYQFTAYNRPSKWMMKPPTSIQLWPAPDQVYESCYVTGFILHPDLTLDADTLLFPTTLHRPFAKFVAATLLDPSRTKESAPRITALMTEAMEAAKEWRRKSEREFEAPRVRGRWRDTPIRRIG
jgi:hypothetical protein